VNDSASTSGAEMSKKRERKNKNDATLSLLELCGFQMSLLHEPPTAHPLSSSCIATPPALLHTKLNDLFLCSLLTEKIHKFNYLIQRRFGRITGYI
jgi:hypothetical protein